MRIEEVDGQWTSLEHQCLATGWEPKGVKRLRVIEIIVDIYGLKEIYRRYESILQFSV